MLTEEANRVFSLLSNTMQGNVKGRGDLQTKIKEKKIGIEYIADML